MHLARQTDAFNPSDGATVVSSELHHGVVRRSPPVIGVLFGPSGPGPADLEGRAGLRDDGIGLVEQDCLYT
jgi:hypothetical protein